MEQIAYTDRLGAAGAAKAAELPHLCDKCRKAVYSKSFK
jgi:hypothetical protein